MLHVDATHVHGVAAACKGMCNTKVDTSEPVMPPPLPLVLLTLLLLLCSGGVGRVVCCWLICCNPGKLIDHLLRMLLLLQPCPLCT
jgi:hypothetical protein